MPWGVSDQAPRVDVAAPQRRVTASPFPGADLRLCVEGALAAEGHLLTAGEVHVARSILALSEGALELYARLSLRQPRVFRHAELDYAGDMAGNVAQLEAASLLGTVVPDSLCLPAFTADELRGACRRLGVDARGNRPLLEERLRGRRWVDEPVLLVRHRALLRRLEILFFQTPHVTRQDLVLERVGVARWAQYAITGGPGLFPRRSALLLWERARAGAWTADDMERALAIPDAGAPLDPWRYAVAARLEALSALPAADRVGPLRALLSGPRGDPRGVRIALARALEEAVQTGEALEVVVAGQGSGSADALACARTARRLARSLKRAIPPVAELRVPRSRTVEVAGGGAQGPGARPTWPDAAGQPVTIERAVVDWLAAVGRSAIHAEQSPWVGLYALVFADAYFLPVPGMLPTAFRSGPVDVGTPGFYARRRAHLDARLDEVSRFGTVSYVERYGGERLSGLLNVDATRFIAAHAPHAMAACVLGRLASEGWGAAAGLPDLFVAPGSPARLALPAARISALPARLPESAFLAEIKGPTDALRDEQRIWIDRLLGSGISVELWELRTQCLK